MKIANPDAIRGDVPLMIVNSHAAKPFAARSNVQVQISLEEDDGEEPGGEEAELIGWVKETKRVSFTLNGVSAPCRQLNGGANFNCGSWFYSREYWEQRLPLNWDGLTFFYDGTFSTAGGSVEVSVRGTLSADGNSVEHITGYFRDISGGGSKTIISQLKASGIPLNMLSKPRERDRYYRWMAGGSAEVKAAVEEIKYDQYRDGQHTSEVAAPKYGGQAKLNVQFWRE